MTDDPLTSIGVWYTSLVVPCGPDNATMRPLTSEELSRVADIVLERSELVNLLDVAHQALDALLSTRMPPATAPPYLLEVMGELHRVAGHYEAPDPARTAELLALVEAAYDDEQTGDRLEQRLVDELERLGAIQLVSDRLADGRSTEGTVDELFADQLTDEDDGHDH